MPGYDDVLARAREGSAFSNSTESIKWNAYGEERARRQDPCPCGHYTGPELISSITMRQITTEQ